MITYLLHRVNGAIDRLRQVTLDLDTTILMVHAKNAPGRGETLTSLGSAAPSSPTQRPV